MAALAIHQFPCRSDNYGVLIHDPETQSTAAIDAPDAGEVLDAIEERGWGLTHIFTTHHHPDHVAGNAVLKERYGCEIVGPAGEADRIPGIDRKVSGGETFQWSGRPVAVIDTPGHTAGEVSYHLPSDGLLFAGDTLFAMGCGRLFEGTPDQMWASLQRLAALPELGRAVRPPRRPLGTVVGTLGGGPRLLSRQSRWAAARGSVCSVNAFCPRRGPHPEGVKARYGR